MECGEDFDCDHDEIEMFDMPELKQLNRLCREAVESITATEKMMSSIDLPTNLISFDALPLNVNAKSLLTPRQIYCTDANCNLELMPGVNHYLVFEPNCWFYTDADGFIHSVKDKKVLPFDEHREMMLFLIENCKHCEGKMLSKLLNYQEKKCEVQQGVIKRKEAEMVEMTHRHINEIQNLAISKVELMEQIDTLTVTKEKLSDDVEMLKMQLKHVETLNANDMSNQKKLRDRIEGLLKAEKDKNVALQKHIDEQNVVTKTIVEGGQNALSQLKSMAEELQHLRDAKNKESQELNKKNQQLLDLQKKKEQSDSAASQEINRLNLRLQTADAQQQSASLQQQKLELQKEKSALQKEVAKLVSDSSTDFEEFRDRETAWFQDKQRLEDKFNAKVEEMAKMKQQLESKLTEKDRQIVHWKGSYTSMKGRLDEQVKQTELNSKKIKEIEEIAKRTDKTSQDLVERFETASRAQPSKSRLSTESRKETKSPIVRRDDEDPRAKRLRSSDHHSTSATHSSSHKSSTSGSHRGNRYSHRHSYN